MPELWPELEASGLPRTCYGSVTRIDSYTEESLDRVNIQLAPPGSGVNMSSVLGHSGSFNRARTSLVQQPSRDDSKYIGYLLKMKY